MGFLKITASCTKELSELIIGETRAYSDSFEKDNMGNVIVSVKAKDENSKEKVAVFCPMDMPELIVTYIEKDGRIRIAPLGKYDLGEVLGKRVTNGEIIGILTAQQADTKDFEKAFVNFGFENECQAEERGILQGTILSFAPSHTYLENQSACSLGAGKLACVNALCMAISEIKSIADKEYFFVFCAQSLLGGRGAAPTAYKINADKALCISTHEGKRLAVRISDKSFTADKDLAQSVILASGQAGIELERIVIPDETSDAVFVQSAAGATKTASISFPVEYKGGFCEVVRKKDIQNLAALILQCLNNI